MSFRANRRIRLLRHGSMSLLALWLVACASPGPPQPPSLHLPETVTDLVATRVGDAVELRWTSPTHTTDGLTVSGPIVAQVCRALPGRSASPCQPVRRLTVSPGESHVLDPLPPALTATETLLLYQVTLLNDRERSAAPSAPAFAAGGPAPPPLAALRGSSVERGVLLEWGTLEAADPIELKRIHQAAVPLTPVRPAPLGAAAREPDVIRLKVGPAESGNGGLRKDVGGTVDETAHRGETYIYTAQRIRTIVLDGHRLDLRGLASPPLTIAVQSSFPPQPPTGLEAIATEQAGDHAIDLSWHPNAERDVTGYLLERQMVNPINGSLEAPLRLTPAPVASPGFHDATVLPGRIYSYTVRAVGAEGKVSKPGAPVREEVPVR